MRQLQRLDRGKYQLKFVVQGFSLAGDYGCTTEGLEAAAVAADLLTLVYRPSASALNFSVQSYKVMLSDSGSKLKMFHSAATVAASKGKLPKPESLNGIRKALHAANNNKDDAPAAAVAAAQLPDRLSKAVKAASSAQPAIARASRSRT